MKKKMKDSLHFTILYAILFAVSYSKCTKLSEFCFQKGMDQKCSGDYGYSCGPGLCTLNRLSCQSIKIWSLLINQYKTEKEHTKALNYYEYFVVNIQECPVSVTKVMVNNDTCLNSEKCKKIIRIPFRLTSSKYNITRMVECKCIGQYSFACGKQFCALNESACGSLNGLSPKKALDIGVKVCQNRNF